MRECFSSWLCCLLLSLIFGVSSALALPEMRVPGQEHSLQVRVPALVGLTKQRASAKLKEAGLQPVLLDSYSQQPMNTVLSQVPKARIHLESGARVQLVVSKGPKQSKASLATTPHPEKVSGHHRGFWWLLFQIPFALTFYWGWRRVQNLK